MFKKLLFIGLALALAMAFLPGCGEKEAPAEEEPVDTIQEEPVEDTMEMEAEEAPQEGGGGGGGPKVKPPTTK